MLQEYVLNREATRVLGARGLRPLIREAARVLEASSRGLRSTGHDYVGLASLRLQLSLLYIEPWRSGRPRWETLPEELVELFLHGALGWES